MNKEKIFIISGEDSGDLHGAKLMESIKKLIHIPNFLVLVVTECRAKVYN